MKTFSIPHLLCKFCCKHQQLYTKKTQRNFLSKQKCAPQEQVKMWWREVWCFCVCCKLNPCHPSSKIKYSVLFPNSTEFSCSTLFLWEMYCVPLCTWMSNNTSKICFFRTHPVCWHTLKHACNGKGYLTQ